MFCYHNFLLILAQSKHKKMVHSCSSGRRTTLAAAFSGAAVLHLWLNLLILIEEIPTLLTTHQRSYGREHAGTSPASRNGFNLNFTALGYNFFSSFFLKLSLYACLWCHFFIVEGQLPPPPLAPTLPAPLMGWCLNKWVLSICLIVYLQKKGHKFNWGR